MSLTPFSASAGRDEPVIGDHRMAPLIAAFRGLLDAMRAAGEALPSDTVTLVCSIRPDDHGRIAAFTLDLLGAGDDEWQDDALLSAPFDAAAFSPAPTTEGTE